MASNQFPPHLTPLRVILSRNFHSKLLGHDKDFPRILKHMIRSGNYGSEIVIKLGDTLKAFNTSVLSLAETPKLFSYWLKGMDQEGAEGIYLIVESGNTEEIFTQFLKHLGGMYNCLRDLTSLELIDFLMYKDSEESTRIASNSFVIEAINNV